MIRTLGSSSNWRCFANALNTVTGQFLIKHVRRSDQLQKKLSPNTNMSRFSLKAQQLFSDSSVSWTVRLATMVCVLVFLYNRQSSAHVWHPTKATVTSLPVDPNDPFYESKSFFSRPCVVTFIRPRFLVPCHGLLVFNISALKDPSDEFSGF